MILKSLTLAVLMATPTLADVPTIVDVSANQSGGTWQFNVSLLHADEGWEHYANGWGIYALDGTQLGYRVLAHPHVNEQPFTRSLSNVTIPTGMTQVIVRPHDLVHGDGPDFAVELR